MDELGIRPIGRVESPLKTRKNAPRQPDEEAPSAWIVLDPELRDAMRDLKPGQEMFVLTWLHQGRRDVLRVRPRRDPERRETGVLATRSPDRPNPIGLHRVTLTAVDVARCRVQVDAIEAIDGTPVLDLKPVLDSDVGAR
jgi:tRNA-Thr(GGU) m(6)t(6)A37 methyltransferase TsaA